MGAPHSGRVVSAASTLSTANKGEPISLDNPHLCSISLLHLTTEGPTSGSSMWQFLLLLHFDIE